MNSITGHDVWLGVEIRHLAALEAVSNEGSFGRAATKLGYTQSAISQQIATLERIVDVRLVERPGGPRPVSLTEAGQLLLRHTEGILARLQAAQALTLAEDELAEEVRAIRAQLKDVHAEVRDLRDKIPGL